MAVAMALFLKLFVLEAYRIPTGSMQPTLIGDERADIADRILVDKLSYVLRAPRRWEVAVFRYPLDRSKNFVKRIAGVGPEELRFEYGDLWRRGPGEDWRIARRPENVMREHWRRLDEDGAGSDAAEGGADASEPSRWIPRDLPASSRWEAHGRALVAHGPGRADYRGGHESIRDGYLDGYPPSLLPWLPPHRGDSAHNEVGDLRVEGRIRALEGTERFTLVLREGQRRYRFELAGPAASATTATRLDAGPSARPTDGGAPLPTSPYRLPPERGVRFAVQNLDDRLALEIDGRELLALEIEPAEEQSSGVTLELEGAGAELEDLLVARDIYYETRTGPIEVPAGCYYMLGDNTQDSSDSREWAYAAFELADADGAPRRVRGNSRSGENPRTVGQGEPGGALTYLVDEWGEKHWFASGTARRLAPELAPFVPRELVQGKALAVFWPLDPIRGIWRLKWVN